jgi:hypothetical protein
VPSLNEPLAVERVRHTVAFFGCKESVQSDVPFNEGYQAARTFHKSRLNIAAGRQTGDLQLRDEKKSRLPTPPT